MRLTRRNWIGLALALVALTACAPREDTRSDRASTPNSAPPASVSPGDPTIPPAPPASPTAAASAGATAEPAEENTQALWAQLRQGTGYVVLLRHAETVAGTGDPPGFRLDDCATQRNLSESGRVQARQIGEAFRAQGVPVHQVLSSQYCRCLETAELLGLGAVEPAAMLNSFFDERTSETEQTEQARQRILEHRDTPGALVMVTHVVNIGAISGVSPQPGEAVVVRGDAQGAIQVVGRLVVQQAAAPPGTAPLTATEVVIGQFAIDQTEVTVGQFRQFVEATGVVTLAERNGGGEVFETGWVQKPGWTWRAPFGEPARDDEPAVHVTYAEAQAFCRWAGKRLPTDAEWAEAAYTERRASPPAPFVAGRTYPYPTGASPTGANCLEGCGAPPALDYAALLRRGRGHAASLTTARGVNGLYDMGANVWEWESHAEAGGQRTRGGSWWYPASEMRVDQSQPKPAETAVVYIGFRCARDSS